LDNDAQQHPSLDFLKKLASELGKEIHIKFRDTTVNDIIRGRLNNELRSFVALLFCLFEV
jgi:hypothetical protein